MQGQGRYLVVVENMSENFRTSPEMLVERSLEVLKLLLLSSLFSFFWIDIKKVERLNPCLG